MPKKITQEEFFQKMKENFGDKFDFSESIYKGYEEDVTYRCYEHGYVTTKARNLIKGYGCKACSMKKVKEALSKTQDKFIEEAKAIYGGKYDYSLVEYVNSNTKVKNVCNDCGHTFETRPADFLRKHGCPYCYGNVRLSTEEFVERAKIVHGDKYDYYLVEYVNNSTKVKIICHEHGVFEQTPNSHLQGKKCPRCALNESKSLVCGIGINDYDEPVKINGEHIDSYNYWTYMLKRCYSESSLKKNASYRDCSVSDEWIYFTNFKKWFDNPENGFMFGYELDKDLLVHNNRVYSESTCCFLPQEINKALIRQKSKRGENKIGVFYRKDINKYVAQIQSGIHQHRQIGIYETEQEAFLAYKAEKEGYLRHLADKYFSHNLITKKVYDALYNYEVMEDD